MVKIIFWKLLFQEKQKQKNIELELSPLYQKPPGVSKEKKKILLIYVMPNSYQIHIIIFLSS